jgi:glycosyltransferase involved in cell wall biosynthesis
VRVLIATVRVPFVNGGAEVHAEGLRQALLAAGHQAQIIAVPFKWYPPERILDHMLACRLLDLSEVVGIPVDRLIGLKFPAYLMPHRRKVLWILHQHRQAYDLWLQPLGDLHRYPNGDEIRSAVQRADGELLPQALHLFANSRNVAQRMKTYCNLEALPLYHPPRNSGSFYYRAAEDFLYFPSRVNPSKRQDLVLQALALTRAQVRVYFSGPAEEPPFERKCAALAKTSALQHRVEWLGPVSEEKKLDLYARTLGVIFPPVDEDYGYVTLEAMLARKPVITCTDSGGPLEFVLDRQTGIVAQPTPEALAAAMDELWQNRAAAERWGDAGRQRYEDLHINWPFVIGQLLQ